MFPFIASSIWASVGRGVGEAPWADRQSVLGVVYDPLRDEMFYASAGSGAYCNDKRLHVSQVDTLGAARPTGRTSYSSNSRR